MRAIQFWILLGCSVLIAGLQLKEIQLSRALAQEMVVVNGDRETIATGPGYDNAWKQLALHIYQRRQDPAMAQILKDQKLEIKETPVTTPDEPPPAAPVNNTPSESPVSSKADSSAFHP